MTAEILGGELHLSPRPATIEVFERTDAGWLRTQVHDGDGEARLAPFAAVAFDTRPWWPAPVEDR